MIELAYNPPPSFVRRFANFVRQSEVRELEILSGKKATPWLVVDSLIDACHSSEISVAATLGEQKYPLFVGGFVPPNDELETALVWMTPTIYIRLARKSYCRMAEHILDHFLPKYGSLCNMVHAENQGTIKWIRRMGFTFSDTTVEVSGHEFLPFFKYAEKPICAGTMSGESYQIH